MNGRLSEAEYDRRKKNGLCMFCGAAGHKAADCNKRKASEASHAAHAAATSSTATNSDAPQSAEK